MFSGAFALCAVAVGIDAYVRHQESLGNPIFFLNLALGLASYVWGALFAAFLLAWLPLKKDAYGLIWSAPLSVSCVFASQFHAETMQWKMAGLAVNGYAIISAILIGTWVVAAATYRDRDRRGHLLVKTLWLAGGCYLMWIIANHLWFAEVSPETGELLKTAGAIDRTTIAWPWYAPIGGLVALVFGYLLGEPHDPVEPDVEA